MAQIKSKMKRAQELIKAGEYDKARRILVTVDHPKADQWLTRLNTIDPPKQQVEVKTKPEKKRGGCARTILFILIVGIAVIVILPSLNSPPRQSQQAQQPQTPQQQSSQSASLGTRSNPYPAVSIQDIQDGRLRVNNIQRNATADVMRTNMFNTEPETGQEWVIVEATFFCDLAPDDICTTSVMRFDLVGKSGEAFGDELLAILDNAFGTEVFGGGLVTGNIGFIIDSAETNLLFTVNQFGKRLFFEIPS